MRDFWQFYQKFYFQGLILEKYQFNYKIIYVLGCLLQCCLLVKNRRIFNEQENVELIIEYLLKEIYIVIKKKVVDLYELIWKNIYYK